MYILQKFNYYIIDGCEIPLTNDSTTIKLRQTINKYGISSRCNNSGNSVSIINNIKNSSKDIFLYMIKVVDDNKYIEVYKSLIKHIWNKVVSVKYKDFKFYNEFNHLVPHNEYERDEQLLVARYIDKNDVVLELGARYGSVSCIIHF